VVHDPDLPARLLVKRVAPPTEGAAGTPGAVFLLGDDATASRDSRSFGPVRLTLVVGRAYRCYAPPDRRQEL
jgi:type IV secretory pathway protease TraF